VNFYFHPIIVTNTMSARTRTGPHWDASSNSYYIARFDEEGNFMCKDYNVPKAELPGSGEMPLQAPSHIHTSYSSTMPTGSTAYAGSPTSTFGAMTGTYNPWSIGQANLPQGLAGSIGSHPAGTAPVDYPYAVHSQAQTGVTGTASYRERQVFWSPGSAVSCELQA
jgi:hypothetical protein